MIFLGTNVISETLKKEPDRNVIAWLVHHDAEIALPTVTIAEIAFGIRKIRPTSGPSGWSTGFRIGVSALRTVFSGSPSRQR